MIQIIRKTDNQPISNAEYLNFLKNRFINKDSKRLSEYFRMIINGKEVNIDSIGFATK